MILDEKVIIKINSRNYYHYINFIHNIKNNEIYEIDIQNILPTSHSKINVKCDVCEKIKIIPYREYTKSHDNQGLYCCSPTCAQIKNRLTNKEKYGVENTFQNEDIKLKIKKTNLEKYESKYPSQSKEIREKIKNSCLEKWGVDNVGKSQSLREKMEQTCLIKYGSSNYTSSIDAKIKRIKNGRQVPDINRTDLELYTKLVRNKTNRVKKSLFEDWDGTDYYDKEYILNNLKMNSFDKSYPTIDHKLSIYYGFINGIDPEIIGDILNLCITKRSINSSKHTKSQMSFDRPPE